jgi:peptidoglycan/LPS O-acetylase OafA/YrhL
MPMTPKPGADVLVPEMALSHFLDFSRAIAAVLVLFFHIRSSLVVPFDSLEAHGWLTRGIFVISTFGHDAVIIFFVLSGYLVGGAVLKMDVKSSSDLWEYWIDRSIRIGPVLIAATVFSIVIQRMTPSSGCADSGVTVLGNALGFQNFLVRPLCNNLPLWSISNEVVYYFVFPVLIAAFSRVFTVWLAISLMVVALVGILSLTLAPLDDTNIIFDFPFWLIGAALWFVPGNYRRLRWLAVLAIAAALLFGRLEFGKTVFWFRDLFLTAAFSFLLVTFRDQPMPQSGVRATVAGYVTKYSRWFAELSFSLYVTHYPLIRLYSYLNFSHHEARYAALTTGIVLELMGLVAFCIMVAFGFSVLFERPRRLFKQVIVRRLRTS